MLPPMAERDPLDAWRRRRATQHFTQPPPRYSEASLVKKMEELGIGRPSTYASILSVLQDRNYVRLEKKRFIPEDRGRLVTAFLTSFFERYVDTGFTASLEDQLDDISGGRAEWREVMRAFWEEFSRAVEQTEESQDLGRHRRARSGSRRRISSRPKPDGSDPRACPACGNGRLGLKLGRFGSFIGCSNYPACQYTRRLAIETGEESGETLKEGIRSLGPHPDTGEEITVRRGPYGLYVQLGENGEDKKQKPRRVSLPRGVDGASLTLEQAIGLLSLPRMIGIHPETKEPIEAGIGRFGPYVRMGAVFGSLDRDDDVLSVGINRAVDVLAKKLASVRTLGPHPKDQEPVSVRKGRFGPYVQHGKTVANLPRGVMMEDVTLDEALALLAEKGKVLKPRGAKGKKAAAAREKPAPVSARNADAERKKAPASPNPATRPGAKSASSKKTSAKPPSGRTAAEKQQANKAQGRRRAAG